MDAQDLALRTLPEILNMKDPGLFNDQDFDKVFNKALDNFDKVAARPRRFVFSVMAAWVLMTMLVISAVILVIKTCF